MIEKHGDVVGTRLRASMAVGNVIGGWDGHNKYREINVPREVAAPLKERLAYCREVEVDFTPDGPVLR